MDDTLRTLAGQLLAVPGAPGSLLPDYFGNTVAIDLSQSVVPDAIECWKLADSSLLALTDRSGMKKLELIQAEQPLPLLELSIHDAVLRAASISGDDTQGPYQVSPLVLALTAIAAGFIAGDREVKHLAAGLYKNAQSLLLIAACRLCG
jgi:hypothetical protein